MPPNKRIKVERLAAYSGHTGSIFAMELDQQSGTLFTGGDDGVLVGWDLNRATQDGKGLLKAGHAIYALKYVADQGILLAGGSDGSLYVIDVKTQKLIHHIRKVSHAIYDIFLRPESDEIWILFAKGFLSVLELSSLKEKHFERISTENLRAAIKLPGSGRVGIACSDYKVVILGNDFEKLHEWQAHNQSVFCFSLHPQTQQLWTGGRDAHINIWDLPTGYELLKSLPAHNFTVNALAVSPDGTLIVSGSRDKSLKIWDAYTFQLLKVVDFKRNQGHTHSINRLAWFKADNSLFSCSDDRTIIRWRFQVDSK